MAKKTRKQKLEEQRLKQAELRAKARETRRPDRDDLARLLLWLMMKEGHKQAKKDGNQAALDKLCSVLVDGLEKQGFDPDEAEDVFSTLERTYRTQLTPGRIKRHLGTSLGTKIG